MLERYSKILENYKRWFPNLYDRTTECWPSGRRTLLASLDDGSKIEYNDFHNTIRDVTKVYGEDHTERMDETAWRKEFGHKLRRAISNRGISQDELSDISGISRQMLSRYVRGTSTPSGYNLTRLSEILGCDVRDFTRFNYIDEE